jgi:hypothetical protein
VLPLEQVRTALAQPPTGPRQVQIVTGFLGKGVHSGAITTLGRGGSDLTATVIGAALELAEVQVRLAVWLQLCVYDYTCVCVYVCMCMCMCVCVCVCVPRRVCV